MTATIDVNVGLIASAPITATATRFLTRASNLLQDEGVLRNFHFTLAIFYCTKVVGAFERTSLVFVRSRG